MKESDPSHELQLPLRSGQNRLPAQISIPLEESEHEGRGRPQTPATQSKHGFMGKVVAKFTRKTISGTDNPGVLSTAMVAGEHGRSAAAEGEQHHVSGSGGMINLPANSVLSTVMNAPQDDIPLCSSDFEVIEGRSGDPQSQADTPSETLSARLRTPDVATVDAARVIAITGVLGMREIAAPIHSGTSAITGANNPMDLVDSISPFLKTLSKFNSVVDKIATIHPYAQAAWTVLSFASKTIIEQARRDNSIYSLLLKMNMVFTFLTNAELQDIESMRTVVEHICHQTLECSYFIREYSQNKKFRARLLDNFISETDARVQDYHGVFDDLMQQFHDRAASNTLVIVHRIWEGVKDMEALAHDTDLNTMPYVGGAGLDTRKLCLEGTRNEILGEITAWINNTEDNTPCVFWLHGSAGTGKSSIAHTISARFRNLGRLGSCYCFDRNQMAEQRDKKIFTTIARDLADHNKEIRSKLVAAIHQDTSLKHSTDILQQWKEMILKPAKTFLEAMAGPVLIVIDALDESGLADSRQHLLRILAGKLNDKESHISQLPAHVRILLTSRPLPDIDNALNGVKHIEQKSMDSIPPLLTERDILHYVSSELSDLKGIHSQGAPASLAYASGGLFEWARLACAYVKGEDDAGLTVKERFEAVLTQNKDECVLLLDDMYRLSLETVFPLNQQMRSIRLDRFWSVMAQILGTAEPLPLSSLGSMRHDFVDEHLQDIDINLIVKPLGALLSGTTDPSIMVRPLHASFSEFLTDESRSGEFFIDLSHIHNELASASLEVMKNQLQFNICKLTSSHLLNSEVLDLAERVKAHISPELSYSCWFWTGHLQHSQFNLPLANAIRAFLNNERLLFWLEVLSLLKRINTCARSLSSVIEWVMSYKEFNDISDNTEDVQRFIRMFGGPISLSMPHLYISAIPFSPKNSHISAKFADKFCRVLQIVSGQNESWPVMQSVLIGHSETIYSVVSSPDGKSIVSGSSDNTIRIWDAETGELMQMPLKGHKDIVRSVAFSPDSKWIASGSDDNTIQVWNAKTGELVHPPLKGHKDWVRGVSFSADSKWIVSGSGDNTVQVWNAETGELAQPPLRGHKASVLSVAFSPNSKYIVSGSSDNTLWVWDAQTGGVVQPSLKGHEGWVRSVAFSPDSKCIASGSSDKTIIVWDAGTGKLMQPPLKGHQDWVRSVAFSPNGKYIVSGSDDKTIRVWNAQTGELVRPPLEGHEDWIRSVAFSPDSKHIISGSSDKTIRVWEAEAGEPVQLSFKGHKNSVLAVAFSSDGSHIISGSSDKTIQVWDAKTGELLQLPLEGHEGSVLSVASSLDGKHIVSGSNDKTIRVWDAETGRQVQLIIQAHDGSVSSVAFSPDSKHIVSGSDDKTVRVWDAETGRQVKLLPQSHEDSVFSVAFSPDGKHIVSGSLDNTIQIWKASTGGLVQSPLKGHQDWVRSVAFSPNGKYIVSGSDDKTIRVWNVETGELVQPPFEGHESSVLSVAFSPDGTCIVSGSSDKTIRVWDAETGIQVQLLLQAHEDSVLCVLFSPDGTCIVSGSDDKTIRVWDARKQRLFQPFGKQGLIRFSSLLEHALVNAVELVGDVTAVSECRLADLVKLTSQGWAHIGPKNKILFWIPPTYHPQWYWPSMQVNIPIPDVQLDLSQMAHGESWELCYSQHNM